jgi:Bacterial PH domain
MPRVGGSHALATPPACSSSWRPGLSVFAAVVGLWFLMWSWSVDRRRRVEVTDEHITVVNVFSRHVVPWTELINGRINHEYGDKFCRLGNHYRSMQPRKSKLRGLAKPSPSIEPSPSIGPCANGACSTSPSRCSPSLSRSSSCLFCRSSTSSAFDELAGDWLIDHVPV